VTETETTEILLYLTLLQEIDSQFDEKNPANPTIFTYFFLHRDRRGAALQKLGEVFSVNSCEVRICRKTLETQRPHLHPRGPLPASPKGEE
jgi:hypothetical protein